jgi:hypothetical protein
MDIDVILEGFLTDMRLPPSLLWMKHSTYQAGIINWKRHSNMDFLNMLIEGDGRSHYQSGINRVNGSGRVFAIEITSKQGAAGWKQLDQFSILQNKDQNRALWGCAVELGVRTGHPESLFDPTQYPEANTFPLEKESCSVDLRIHRGDHRKIGTPAFQGYEQREI